MGGGGEYLPNEKEQNQEGLERPASEGTIAWPYVNNFTTFITHFIGGEIVAKSVKCLSVITQ